MKRTTIYLDESVDLELPRLAKQRERSKADVIREALDHYVARDAKPRRLPRSVGMGHSGRPDLAEHDEALLAEMFCLRKNGSALRATGLPRKCAVEHPR